MRSKTALYGLLLIVFILSAPTPAAEAETNGPGPEFGTPEEQVKKVNEQIRKQREEMLQRMKEVSPDIYQQTLKMQERQERIDKILEAFRQNTLSAEDAERRLAPLVREEIREQAAAQNEEIRRLENRLSQLRQAKDNPEKLVKKRVDQMLGRGGPPSPDDLF